MAPKTDKRKTKRRGQQTAKLAAEERTKQDAVREPAIVREVPGMSPAWRQFYETLAACLDDQ